MCGKDGSSRWKNVQKMSYLWRLWLTLQHGDLCVSSGGWAAAMPVTMLLYLVTPWITITLMYTTCRRLQYLPTSWTYMAQLLHLHCTSVCSTYPLYYIILISKVNNTHNGLFLHSFLFNSLWEREKKIPCSYTEDCNDQACHWAMTK